MCGHCKNLAFKTEKDELIEYIINTVEEVLQI